VLIADLDGDGELEVACAVSREENLRAHSLIADRRCWGHSLGEVPAGLALLNGPAGPVLFAATDGATAVAFAPEGDPRWTLDVSPGVSRVIRTGDTAAVICAAGRVLHVRAEGSAEPMGVVAGRVAAATPCEGSLVVADGDGGLYAFTLPA
jgi:hypothetical protein